MGWVSITVLNHSDGSDWGYTEISQTLERNWSDEEEFLAVFHSSLIEIDIGFIHRILHSLYYVPFLLRSFEFYTRLQFKIILISLFTEREKNLETILNPQLLTLINWTVILKILVPTEY